ncbi:MAG: coenzyme Q-binding protein [Hyphomicrobiales bacterium]|jgi:coenzyme Q-binding protein COQ10|nr:coenzyme Q-binding protein [Hyphomicrobiales bacterium]
MRRFRTTRRVGHTAAEMFDLVADIERYPQFLPLVASLRTLRRTDNPDGTETLVADMTVAYKLIRETFTCRVTLDRPNLKIRAEYIDGPFSELDNRWTFTPVSERSCDVEFYIAYEFKSRMFGLLMGAMFDMTFRRFAEAFERRADGVYGRAKIA